MRKMFDTMKKKEKFFNYIEIGGDICLKKVKIMFENDPNR